MGDYGLRQFVTGGAERVDQKSSWVMRRAIETNNNHVVVFCAKESFIKKMELENVPSVSFMFDVLFQKNIKLAQLETPIARYKPGQKEKSGNSCCFQHIDHLFLGHHHHITGTPSQNDQGTIKT